MQAVVSNLMALVLGIHALVGCFCHRPNCAVEPRRVETATCEHADHGCCHEHDPAHESSPENLPAPCSCKIECRATCVFLPVEKVGLDAPMADLHLDVPAFVPAISTAQVTVAVAQQFEGASPRPEPLYLLHQILLI